MTFNLEHKHFLGICYILVVTLVVVLGVSVFIYANVPSAFADNGETPYGGTIMSIGSKGVACPVFAIVQSADPLSFPQVYGMVIPPPPPPPLLYDYQMIYIPGTPLLGEHDPFPDVLCSVPGIPVYDVFYDIADGPFYLTGTGGIPGTY